MDSLPPGVPLSEIPAGIPPPGVIPNLVDPPNLAAATLAVGSIIVVLTTSFTALRMIGNSTAGHKLGLSDYSCIGGAILSIAYAVLVMCISSYSRHQYDIPLSWYGGGYFKLLYVQTLLLNLSIFFAKNAVLLLYFRVFSIDRPLRLAIYGAMIFTIPLYWTQPFLESYYCTPRPGHHWDLSVGQTCAHTIIWGVIQGVLNVALDIYMLLLPVPAILNLQLSKGKKMGVIAVFGTALFALIASILAMAYRIKLHYSDDVAWTQSQLFICVICENNLIIICSCMPAIAGLWRRHSDGFSLLRSWRTSFFSRSGSTAKSHSTSDGARVEKSLPSLPKPQNSYYGSNSSDSPSFRQGAYFDLNNRTELGFMKAVNVEQQSWLAGRNPR